MNKYIEKEVAIENSNLKEVWISSRYTLVRAGVFNYDPSIYSLIIPNPVKRICNGAFSRCEELTSVSLPDSLVSIGHWAFSRCPKLTSITIPQNVTEVGHGIFRGCRELTSVTVLGSVLPDFCMNKKLSTIKIGENLDIINLYAFENSFIGCNNIKTIIIDENNKYFDSRNNCNAIIHTSSDTLVLACNSTVIPEGIKHISAGAFKNCGRKKTLSLPESIESIKSLPDNVKKIIVPKGRKVEFKKKLPWKRGIILEEK